MNKLTESFWFYLVMFTMGIIIGGMTKPTIEREIINCGDNVIAIVDDNSIQYYMFSTKISEVEIK